jgi:hypothetical protein
MGFHGPKPMETDAATYVLGETLVNLQRRIRDDLKAAAADKVTERPVLGALACLRALLEAFPEHGFHCHPEDIEEWRDQYLAWFDANASKIRLKAADKKQMRELAVKKFDRVAELGEGSGYRLDEE